MTDPQAPAPIFRFDRYELRPQERVLLADGAPVKLGGRAFDTLAVLVEHRGRVVSKPELMDAVWPKLVVEENNLQAQVVVLRKLMGPAAIATVPGRGYRLTLPIEPDGADESAASGRLPPSVPRPARTHNLPHCVEALIGRERDLQQLHVLIAANRLVTVTGFGGIGKTRVAIDAATQCADRFADGVWLVELSALGDPALLGTAVNNALGIAVPAGLDPIVALAGELRDRRLLLVLDSCEHLIDAVANLVESVLSSGPGVCVLASSQEPIGIAGEQVFRLPSLAVPAQPTPTAAEALTSGAVQLFVTRAKAVDPGFVLDDKAAPVVAAICRRLDGIPLALEMAAARLSMLGVDALAGRLDERFRVLTAGRRTALPRQRTLHATLDWSFGLLSHAEQIVFRRLGVFSGPFSLEASLAVAAEGESNEFGVIDSLAGLCAKSLVATDKGDADARYRLLETTRAYALERLVEVDETAAATRRHAMHYLRFFAACFDDWTLLSDADFRMRYAQQIDNLRAAVGWALGPDGDSDTAIALVGSSVPLWMALSLYSEAEALLDRAFERLTASTPAFLEAGLWLGVATVRGSRNKARTVDAARRAADLYRACGNSVLLGCALTALGSTHAAEADTAANAVLIEARPLLERTGRARLIAWSKSAFALLHGASGRSENAVKEAQAALALYRTAGAEGSVLRLLGSLADLTWMQGDLDGAIGATREVLDLQRQSPFTGRLSFVFSMANLFGMLVERGDLDEARGIGRELLPTLRELRLTHGWLDHYASFASRVGRGPDAVRLVGWADAFRDANELKRQSNERRAREATLALTRQSLAAADVDRLLAEGAAISEEEICRIAPS